MPSFLLLLSIVISLLGISAVSFYAATKFLKLWRKFREESLFHLGILFLEFIIYMLFIIIVILASDNPETSNLLLKRYLGIIYSFLALEMSMFYLTTFINQRSLWEKYIPYTLGATFGIAFVVMIIRETDPWYDLLSIIVYILPFIPVSILATKVVIRAHSVYKDPQMAPEDKDFVMAIGVGSVFMFVGALGDMSFFWIIIITNINFWDILVITGGFIAPIIMILVFYIVRKIFINIEQADVVHLMNLLS